MSGLGSLVVLPHCWLECYERRAEELLEDQMILSFTKSSSTKLCRSYSMMGSLPFAYPLTRDFAVSSGQIMSTPILMSIGGR